MKKIIMWIGICFSLSHAQALNIDRSQIEGRYLNPAYGDGIKKFLAWVDIITNEEGQLELRFNIPCGTKLVPKRFIIIGGVVHPRNLKLVDEGDSQCYTGKYPTLEIYGDQIEIFTHPIVKTPGFPGVYQLTKKIN